MLSNVIIAIIALIITLILFIIVLILTRTPRIVYRNSPGMDGIVTNEYGETGHFETNSEGKRVFVKDDPETIRRKKGKRFSFEFNGANGTGANEGTSGKGSGGFNMNFSGVSSGAQKGLNGAKGFAGSAAKGISKFGNDIDHITPREDIFRFMQFDRITDGMIVQLGGKRYTKALKCKGINYDLMSEAEQMAVEQGFITFLNTLKYPIQLYVQAQNVDLKQTIANYKVNTKHFEDEYNEINREYARLSSSFDVDEKEMANVTKERDSISNVYEYSRDIIKYVEKMQSNKNMLQRSFYVLLSYNTSEINASDKFDDDEKFEMCSTELSTRCQAIQSALTSCSVSSEILNSNDLAELLYAAYNRDDTGLISVKESLESGFYRLYSVSEDAFEREQGELDTYMQNQAKIRALEAIKYAIENDEVTTPAMEELEEEEEISRTATNMVNAEAFPDEFKEKVDKKILDDYRDTKKELLEEDRQQKEVIREQFEKDKPELERLKNEPKPHGIELIERSEELAKQERQSTAFGEEVEGEDLDPLPKPADMGYNTNTNNTNENNQQNVISRTTNDYTNQDSNVGNNNESSNNYNQNTGYSNYDSDNQTTGETPTDEDTMI